MVRTNAPAGGRLTRTWPPAYSERVLLPVNPTLGIVLAVLLVAAVAAAALARPGPARPASPCRSC